MASNRSFSEIVSTMVDRLRLTQPNLDTKPGSVARDCFSDTTETALYNLASWSAGRSINKSLATDPGFASRLG